MTLSPCTVTETRLLVAHALLHATCAALQQLAQNVQWRELAGPASIFSLLCNLSSTAQPTGNHWQHTHSKHSQVCHPTQFLPAYPQAQQPPIHSLPTAAAVQPGLPPLDCHSCKQRVHLLTADDCTAAPRVMFGLWQLLLGCMHCCLVRGSGTSHDLQKHADSTAAKQHAADSVASPSDYVEGRSSSSS